MDGPGRGLLRGGGGAGTERGAASPTSFPSLHNCPDSTLLPICKLNGGFCRRTADFQGLRAGGCLFPPPPRALLLFSSPGALPRGGKQLWRPPGGAGVAAELAASAQLSGGRGGGCDAEDRARTLFRLRQSGRRAAVRALARLGPLWPGPPPEPPRRSRRLPFSASPCRLPRAPRSRAPGAPAHRWGKGGAGRGDRNSRRKRAGRQGRQAARSREEKVWWRRVLSRPRRRLARGRAFLPCARVWAAGLELEARGDCRLRVRPRGKPRHRSVLCG